MQGITKRLFVLALVAAAVAGCNRRFIVEPPDPGPPPSLTGTWRGETRISADNNTRPGQLWLELSIDDQGVVSGTGSTSADGAFLQLAVAGSAVDTAEPDTDNLFLELDVVDQAGGQHVFAEFSLTGRWDGFDRILYMVEGDGSSLGWFWLDRWSHEGPQ